ncbi:MAG: hypothetical protein ACREP6_12125 [Candidatus Binataceae bacterium]
MSHDWPWLAIAMLGAYHGIDPSMGWLFAVALGLQEKSRTRLLESLLPIALGHLLSIALVVALIGSVETLITSSLFRLIGAGALILFGIFRVLWPRAHPRWVAMRVGMSELVLWSFLMSAAHGAGLMLFPILVGMPMPAGMHHVIPALGAYQPMIMLGVEVVLLHTGAMLLVMGAAAVAVYEWVGLAILRSAWVNLDTLWAGALVAAGVLALVV